MHKFSLGFEDLAAIRREMVKRYITWGAARIIVEVHTIQPPLFSLSRIKILHLLLAVLKQHFQEYCMKGE